ncbi:outer membrane beta-barrel protein [Rhodoblastus acidophilus]|uniref:Outer membrane beta-barrel protein n=1 Tax=Candidatus Rhodoblastus alkanivorans TaxID=2954117 RepID=A0ABS9Z7P6_9HYPH|nr:outer membrane beta-barrel protein [Candidatus Rhodoblastus alkanivorans]MCI4678385.1 outer membrane beta-barrel protein [Candidatus Rhodoblastus alkanivorans]MCI4683643.1 outer membrane beta-barrel protein [Candidatus Rhodoblastus alkanivorans]MDI4640959.1 outer membrane beta-barrel protein [Rhodoblastus acidophilus]
MPRSSITVFTVASAIALAQAASAADLGQPAPAAPPPPAAPVYNWTGFYGGLNAGVGWSANGVNTAGSTLYTNSAHSDSLANATVSALGATANIPASTTSFIGGGQIGYNYQINPWVAGLEVDFAGFAQNSQTNMVQVLTPIPGIGTNSSQDTATRKLDYLGTVRGRLGYLVTPALLLYGTGGLAYGDPSLTTDVFQARTPRPFGNVPWGTANSSSVQAGWALGAGAEWMFMPHWSARVEYLHYDLGTVSNDFSISHYNAHGALIFVNNVQSRAQFDGDVIRVGVNYHFD